MCITVHNSFTKLLVQVFENFYTVAVLSNKFVSDLHQTTQFKWLESNFITLWIDSKAGENI